MSVSTVTTTKALWGLMYTVKCISMNNVNVHGWLTFAYFSLFFWWPFQTIVR